MSSSVGTSPGTLDRAGVRAWLGLALLAVSCALVSANANLLNLALPSIAAELRPNGAQLLWISDAYAFAVAGLLMPAGLAADRLGRRRVLLGGAALFGLASIGASLSTSAGSLIAFRVLLGAAGALLGPSTISLIRSMFPDPRQRAVALGVWTAGFALGGIVGPPVGGVLLAAAGWRAVFALAPPVMALVVLLGRFTLPEYRQASTRPLDWVGLVVMIVGLLTTVTAVKQVAGGAPFLLPTVVASVGLVLLVGSLER